LLPSTSACAEMYRCVLDGSTTYSQTPCPHTDSKPIKIPVNQATSDEYKQALKKNAQDKIIVKKLENSRHKNDAKYEGKMKTIAARNEKEQQKCTKLQASVKWAEEDLKNAQPKAEMNARLKLKRASEKASLQCKRNG
jgi:hypothetical protein